MISELELKARKMIEDFRNLEESKPYHDDCFVSRQSMLIALRAIWSEQFTLNRLCKVAEVLAHVDLNREENPNPSRVVRRMVRAGLIRRSNGRKIDGPLYEMNI